ncbi:hypothetical protein ACHAWU_006285 [Discostella pseudostelligera]|uniref:Cell division control protein 73 C-terminal domain-containing protein n=1 Tax=Discostella pseudostelligera TaxID=259834 RepID=A0ABD3M9K8_9STRA
MTPPPPPSSSSASAAIELLIKACSTNNLTTQASLSDDGKIFTLYGTSYDATSLQTITTATKEVTYTLASIYLQLLHPSVLQYRQACNNANVEDPVKILDKAAITNYFEAAADTATAGDELGVDDGAPAEKKEDAKDVADADGDITMDFSGDEADGASRRQKEEVENDKRPRSGSRGEKDKHRRESSRGRDKDKHDKGDSSRNKHHSKSRNDNDDRKGGGGSSKAPKGPITNEQLVANLSTIVDKRDAASANLALETPAKSKVQRTDDENNDATAAATSPIPATTPVLSEEEGGFSQPDDDGEKMMGTDYDRDLLLAWLSPEGFQVDSPTVAAAIEADRDAVRRITALEIPVGDSASILRAGAGGEIIVDKSGSEVTGVGAPPGAVGVGAGGNVKKRDFARVLEIYQEVVAAEEGAKRSSSSSGKKPPPPPPPSSSLQSKSPQTSSLGGSAATTTASTSTKSNPIIVVPNAMTSAITMINAGFFLGKDAVFIPRDQAMQNPLAGKRGGTISITRKLAPRLGGADITYDIIDNPATRLKKDEWNKVVAVICQGAAWQFKGWRYSDPVDLFSRTFGFYVGLEGASVPNELRGWNVKTGKVSRDRRGLDNVCLASFWNGLEEFMAVHKQDFIKSS